jgi:hypothetical protein
MRRATHVEEDGRGLHIVAQMARNWGTRYSVGGKTIWAEHLIGSTGGVR